jgi:hypothetical protein
VQLNCQSPKGREALEQNARALEKLSQQTGLQFLSFSSEQPSCADGIIVDGTTPISLFEVKSRAMDLPKLEFEWGFRWMISEHKLIDNQEVSVRLKLPFTGILHCLWDDAVLMQTIWDPDGKPLAEWRVFDTTTPKNINGGQKHEPTAYVDMTEAIIYK